MRNHFVSIVLVALLLPIMCGGGTIIGPCGQAQSIRTLLFEAKGDYSEAKKALEASSDIPSVMVFNAAFLPYFYLFFEEDLQKADAASARLMALYGHIDSHGELETFYRNSRSFPAEIRQQGGSVADALLRTTDHSDFQFIDMFLTLCIGAALQSDQALRASQSTDVLTVPRTAVSNPPAKDSVVPNPPAKPTEADVSL